MTAITARPAARLNPDSLPVLIAATTTAAVVLAASFLWSWDALVAVSGWAGARAERAWVVPVVLDGATLVYTLAVIVQRARGRRAALAWTALTVFTTASVVLNVSHALVDGTGTTTWQRALGGVVAGLAPIAVLLATHTLAALLVRLDGRTDDGVTASASAGRTDADAGTRTDAAHGWTDASTDAGRTDDDVTAAAASAARTDDAPDDRTDAGADGRTDTGSDIGPDAGSDGPDADVVRLPVASVRTPRTTTRTDGRRRVEDHHDDVVRLLASGLTAAGVARELGLSRSSVYVYAQRVRPGVPDVVPV